MVDKTLDVTPTLSSRHVVHHKKHVLILYLCIAFFQSLGVSMCYDRSARDGGHAIRAKHCRDLPPVYAQQLWMAFASPVHERHFRQYCFVGFRTSGGQLRPLMRKPLTAMHEGQRREAKNSWRQSTLCRPRFLWDLCRMFQFLLLVSSWVHVVRRIHLWIRSVFPPCVLSISAYSTRPGKSITHGEGWWCCHCSPCFNLLHQPYSKSFPCYQVVTVLCWRVDKQTPMVVGRASIVGLIWGITECVRFVRS